MTDLVYTINDSGNAPLVFAVQVSTGKVVGTTRIEGGELRDTEAISIDRHGTLWISDTGDNLDNRTDAALYALPEPGTGNHTVTATRYPIRLPRRAPECRGVADQPRTDAKFLVSKGLFAGTIYSLPKTLRTGRANVAQGRQRRGCPARSRTRTFTTDGAYAVLRNYGSIYVVDPKAWSVLHSEDSPAEPQGEAITAEASGRSFLVGSEGHELRADPRPVRETSRAEAGRGNATSAPTTGQLRDVTRRLGPRRWR